MIFPPTRTMLSLVCFAQSIGGFMQEDGTFVILMPAGPGEAKPRGWIMTGDELDELARLGWIVLLPPEEQDKEDQARLILGETAVYWINKWAKKNHADLTRMRIVRA